jgi:hypothetical protein
VESGTRPDRESVVAARQDIASSPDDVKDEMLNVLLEHSYPQRVSQDN